MQNTNSIATFNQGYLFIWHMMALGYILILGSLFAFSTNMILGMIMLAIGLFIVSSRQGIIIDFSSHTYFDYSSYLFIKTGDKGKFNTVDKIYINKVKMKQQMNSPRGVQSHQSSFDTFNAYIKFDNGEKFLLKSSKDKESLIASLAHLESLSKIKLEDNSTN